MLNKNDELLKKEQISAEELQQLMEKYTVIVLDVRTKEEYFNYHIKNAINLPYQTLTDTSLTEHIKIHNAEFVIVVTYCNSGGRGGKSFTLFSKSNDNPKILVKNLTHGINEWIDKGYPIVENSAT